MAKNLPAVVHVRAQLSGKHRPEQIYLVMNHKEIPIKQAIYSSPPGLKSAWLAFKPVNINVKHVMKQ